MKKFFFTLIVLCCVAPFVVAQEAAAAAAQDAAVQPNSADQNDQLVEEIVARVNDSIITLADLRRNEQQTAEDAREQHLSASQIAERKDNALRDLIDQQLLLQKAKELGITADAELVKRLDDLRKQLKAGSMEELQKMAEGQGISWEDFKQNTRNSILSQKVIGSEVGGHIQITQEDVQKYYDEHKDEFSQPERVRLAEILVANDPLAPAGSTIPSSADQVAVAEAKAKQIYQELKQGTSFDALARKESNGSTAAQGGDLGYFKRGELAKVLEDQTFSLKSGEFTAPIQTRQGFIILRVLDHIEPGVPPLDSVRSQIQDQIYSERIQPALRAYLTKLRGDAYIDVRSGYTDTGASTSETKLIYTTDSGPRTKQVRGKFGLGKKRTVVVAGKNEDEVRGRTSEIGSAKREVLAKEEAIRDRKAAREAAAAKAAAAKAEKEELKHMTRAERKKYLAEKKRAAREQAKFESQELHDQREKAKQAKEEEARKAAEAKAAKHGKKSSKESAASSPSQASAENKTPTKKKSFSWF